MNNPREGQPDPERSRRELDQATAQRIATTEAIDCLPTLRQALADVALGQQMRYMAAYAGDAEVEGELRQALQELAQAAAV